MRLAAPTVALLSLSLASLLTGCAEDTVLQSDSYIPFDTSINVSLTIDLEAGTFSAMDDVGGPYEGILERAGSDYHLPTCHEDVVPSAYFLDWPSLVMGGDNYVDPVISHTCGNSLTLWGRHATLGDDGMPATYMDFRTIFLPD